MKLPNGRSRFKCVQLACTCKQCGFTEVSMESSPWLARGGVGPGSGVDLEMEADNVDPLHKAGKLLEGRTCAVLTLHCHVAYTVLARSNYSHIWLITVPLPRGCLLVFSFCIVHWERKYSANLFLRWPLHLRASLT